MSIAQETSSEVTSTLKSIIEKPMSAIARFLLDLAKTKIEMNMRNQKKDHLASLKYGQIDTKSLESLSKKGVKLAYSNLPAEYIDRLAEIAPNYLAHFSIVEIKPGNIASIAYPESDANGIASALKRIASEQEEKVPGCMKFKDKAIAPEDVEVTNTVLECHDIPTFMFTSNNKNMAVVPKEFEQQFDSAVKEAKAISEKISDLNIISFEQTQDLASLDYIIDEVDISDAKELNSTLSEMKNAPNVKFVMDLETNKVTMIYPASDKERMANIKDTFFSDKTNADKMIVNVVGNDITINKKSLVESETAEQYFAKVPNTKGEQYIYLDKKEFSEKNGTIKGCVDVSSLRKYSIYDKQGKLTAEITGKELADKYSSTSKFINKDTKIAYSDTNDLEHIELYNASENKLMKIGIDSSENIKKVLIAQGNNNRTADIILKKINEGLTDEQKNVFGYTDKNAELKSSNIENVEQLKSQYNIAQQITAYNATDISDMPFTKGEKAYIFDKDSSKYVVLPSKSRTELSSLIQEKFGYDSVKSMVIADKAIANGMHNAPGKEIETHYLDTNNILLHNVRYAQDKDNMFVFADKGDKINFMSFDKTVERKDIERVIKSELKITDNVAVAQLMNKFDTMNVISPCTNIKADNLNVSLTTSTHYTINNGINTITIPKNEINAETLSKSFDLNLSSAEQISKSINATILKCVDGKENSLNKIIKTIGEKVLSVTKGTLEKSDVSLNETKAR